MNDESLQQRAEVAIAALQEGAMERVSDLVVELQARMQEAPESRASLGPLLGRLKSLARQQMAPAPIELTWVSVGGGHLAIGGRPKSRLLPAYLRAGTTHVLTLLSASEHAEEIGAAVTRSGLDWLWFPMAGAGPSAERIDEFRELFARMRGVLSRGARIYVHCAAGIHRTGMVTYAFLRDSDHSTARASELLGELRGHTAEHVGDHRLVWGDQFAR